MKPVHPESGAGVAGTTAGVAEAIVWSVAATIVETLSVCTAGDLTGRKPGSKQLRKKQKRSLDICAWFPYWVEMDWIRASSVLNDGLN